MGGTTCGRGDDVGVEEIGEHGAVPDLQSIVVSSSATATTAGATVVRRSRGGRSYALPELVDEARNVIARSRHT